MYQVMTAAARMPNSCWGRYRHVAVVETDTDDTPRMISERARGVRRIVRHFGPQHVGKTARSAYGRAIAAATALAISLNDGCADGRR